MKPIVRRIVRAVLSAALMAGAVVGGVSLVLRLLDERERVLLSEGVVTVADRQEGEGAQPFTLYERIDMLSGSLHIQTASRPPYNTEASLSDAVGTAGGFLSELMAVFCDEAGLFTPEGMTFGEKMARARVNAYLVDVSSVEAGDMRMSLWLVEYTWGQPAPGIGPAPTPEPTPSVRPGETWTRLTSAQLVLDSVNLQPYAAVYHFEGEHPSVAFAEARAKEEAKLAALHMDEYNEAYLLETSLAHAQVLARAVDMERDLSATPSVTTLDAEQFPLWHSMAPVMSGLGLWGDGQTFCQYDLGDLQVLTNDITGNTCAVALHSGDLKKVISFSFDDYSDLDVYWETGEAGVEAPSHWEDIP